MSVPVPDPPPAATSGDLARLRTPEAWQEWLAEHNGETAWAGGELVPETNYMARARPGEVAGGYVKSAATRDGLAIWEKVR